MAHRSRGLRCRSARSPLTWDAVLPELQSPARVVETAEGRGFLWAAGPKLVFTRMEGRMALEHARAVIDFVGAHVHASPGEVVVVHDLCGVESYEVAVYARILPWSVAAGKSARRVVIGASSPLIALAVRTINLAASGRFEVLDSRERVLEAARLAWQKSQTGVPSAGAA